MSDIGIHIKISHVFNMISHIFIICISVQDVGSIVQDVKTKGSPGNLTAFPNEDFLIGTLIWNNMNLY